MKKTFKFLGYFAIVMTMAAFITQCSKDETKVGKISGVVMMADETPADGAIVTLSSGANGTDVVTRVVADASGAYSIPGIAEGTFYLNAKWEPSNNNNLEKSTGTVILTGVEQTVTGGGDVTVNVVLAGAVSGGTALFDAADWKWDNTHSTVAFEFPYDAFNAVFAGIFNRVGFDELIFDEANPENSSIKAWVDVTSVETGAAGPPCAHGRDGINGCIGGTFAVDIDPNDTVNASCVDGTVVTNWPNESLVDHNLFGGPSTYQRQSAVVGNTGVATFESTSVKAYGTGYVATGVFTFAGMTSTVDMYFDYIEGYSAVKGDDTIQYSSFYGWFSFAAAADYGIVSGHIGDADVTVKVSAQFNKVI